MKGKHNWGGFPWPPNEFFIVRLQNRYSPYGCAGETDNTLSDSLKGPSSEWIMADSCMLAHFIDHFDVCFGFGVGS